MKKFSSGKAGRQTLNFLPAPHRAPVRPFAVLVFTWHNNQVLLCDIENRGWSIPGGRVEAEESTQEAAHREALEEAGAVLGSMQYIGCYRMVESNYPKQQIRWADAYVANVKQLVSLNPNFESNGRQLFNLEEIPQIYYQWNELVSEVFKYSRDVLSRFETLQKQYLD